MSGAFCFQAPFPIPLSAYPESGLQQERTEGISRMNKSGLVSLLFLFPLIIGLIYLNKIMLASAILSLVLFYFLPILIIEKNINKLCSVADNQRIILKFYDYVIVPIWGIVILFTDSLGPFLTICDKAKSMFSGSMPYKQKTER
ncbi:MAG: hypothetical protein NTW50_04995 [Candidatus Berkelbacteria bacterium]|nr:hypothetical protein [Candidatus Berkelbacteria bacterium]